MEPPQEAPPEPAGDVVFVLEGATLEVAKVGRDYALLNCDDHAAFLRKHKRDPAEYRPDILHQARAAAGRGLRWRGAALTLESCRVPSSGAVDNPGQPAEQERAGEGARARSAPSAADAVA